MMKSCQLCGTGVTADAIGLCRECITHGAGLEPVLMRHAAIRHAYMLPAAPPRSRGGRICRICAHECMIGEGETGYCGLRHVTGGRLQPLAPLRHALAYAYLDPLPTNCCASWFCRGSKEKGMNLAIFFFGCNFDCLFCQNATHKEIRSAPVVSESQLLELALMEEVRCICFFGGSPEPQLPFAIHLAEEVLRSSANDRHICWEWNGAGHPSLSKRAADLSRRSGGVVKFDLKAFDPHLHMALTGTDNARVLENFTMLAGDLSPFDAITATTLLLPHYIDGSEVHRIAEFIRNVDDGISYSLLAFHPAFMMNDLPVTTRRQAEDCLAAARSQLKRVHLGNAHLVV